MEISVNQENLRFLQSYIRKFINDDQYEESLILNIQNENETITYKNDDLILFLQDKKLNENNYICNVSLIKEYKYQFNYFNENITVIVNISKQPQALQYNNIFGFDWNTIIESISLQAPEMFINDIKYVFYLKNPDIEHYCRENKHISETISFCNDNDDNDNLLKLFSVNKNTDIKVHQITKDNFTTINTNINKYLINVKIDGIRTLIVIVNNIIKCYQGDKKFIYNYNEPVIEGSYIFDCELCNGNLHIFDCWYACPDSSIYNSNFDIYKRLLKTNDGNDRISVIDSFCEKYNFIKFNVLNITECPIKNITFDYRIFCNYIREFIENETLDTIINYKKTFSNRDFSQKYYDDLSTNIDETIEIAKDVNNFNKKLYNMYTQNHTYKQEAYNLCRSFNVPQDIMYAYSPCIILGLIYYYYLIDFNDDNLIFKKYVYSNNFVENNKSYLSKPLTPTISMFYKDSQYPKDGLIFVNNSPIDFARKNKTIYYKWKPKDKLSFDIKIDFDKDDVINIYGNTENYALATFMNSKGKNIENSRIKIELNNFNKTLPCCKNGDIVLSGDIVEIVPYYNGFNTEYIFLRIRYDKVKANGETTIKTIKNNQTNYTNLIMELI